ncbi:MAG: coenzyme F420-0:L-glutamate ligase [Actinomycetota bacterium]
MWNDATRQSIIMANLNSTFATLRHRRASQIWLRDPSLALRLIGPDSQLSDSDSLALSVLAWLSLTYQGDEAKAERVARRALSIWTSADTRLASAALAEILLRRGDNDEAVEVLRAAQRKLPNRCWYVLSIADALIEGGRVEEAEAVLEPQLEHPQLRRHVLKRLSGQALDRGDKERARRWFGELVNLPLVDQYIVYASDYLTFGDLLIEAGATDEARELWRKAADIYRRDDTIRARLADHFGETIQTPPPQIASVDESEAHVQRIPVRTPYINARSDMIALIEEATRELRQPGDVVALAESPAANGQGRVISLELVQPSRTAKFLSRYVGAIGPLHSDEGMQGAIMVAGRVRVLAGAAAGAVGKALGRSGDFYRVAGRQTAMIDDVAAAVAPYDHHLLPGPAEPDALANRLAAALGCEAAIVDANDLSGAWVIGASPGVDREWLERALIDNPAGNEDERTPVVIVRRTS